VSESIDPGSGPRAARPAPNDHTSANPARVRVLGALLFGAPAVVFAVLGGWWFTGLALAAILIATFEAVRLMRASGFSPPLGFTLAFATVFFAAIAIPQLPAAALLTAFLLGSLAWQMRHRQGQPIADWAITVATGCYLGWTGGHLAALREIAAGCWLALAVALTWAADSGAYLIGRRFGKRRMAPSLSPKKTWEGYAGGVAAAAAVGALIGLISPIGPLHSAALGLLVGFTGTLGDLAESMFKRQAGSKDSGHLIPGHGGVFDRIDSLLWAGVVVYYYATAIYPALTP
jgi:phosphatidate cytidylyltransferase